ncbi:MAG: hypothetical protein ACLT1L_03200 [Leuconostoc lactis]|uniref:hypothetical protein n=1 Tax=Leuconostoc lactis TaxID=1246 RepID=UPI0039947F4A
METIDFLKSVTPVFTICISLWALINSYRTNRHKDNFAIAQLKYFGLLVTTLPGTIAEIEYEPNGNIKQATTIKFLASLDDLRAQIDHLVILDTRKYRKIIKKLDLIDNNISLLSTATKNSNFKETKEWKQIMSSLSYIVKSLLLNV